MRIIQLARFILLIMVVVVLAYYMPLLYKMNFETAHHSPFIVYSPVIEDFIITRDRDEVGVSHLKWKDTKGNLYSREDNDLLLPFFYYRQLASQNKMPDSIRGIATPLDSIRKHNFNYRLRPSTINSNEIPLYSLLESASGRVRLEMPDDFFRINDRMEFIDCATNIVNEEKTRIFTNALITENFRFPAKIVAGNPTTRKPFDEGYFIVDDENKLFHVKMVKGEPLCVNTNWYKNEKIRYVSVKESGLREFYAYIITQQNNVYLLSYDNYKPIKLPVSGYNADEDILFIIGDYFYRTISVIHDDKVELTVTDRNYNVVDNYNESWDTFESSVAGKVSKYLFPFTIDFRDENTSWYSLYPEINYNTAFPIMLLCAIILAVVLIARGTQLKKSLPDLIFVLLTGLYGLIAVLIFKNNLEKDGF